MSVRIVRAKGGVQTWAKSVDEKNGIITAWTQDERVAATVHADSVARIAERHLSRPNGGALKFLGADGRLLERVESPDEPTVYPAEPGAPKAAKVPETGDLLTDLKEARDYIEIQEEEIARLNRKIDEQQKVEADLHRRVAALEGELRAANTTAATHESELAAAPAAPSA